MKGKQFRWKPRRVLRLPDLDHAKTAVLNTLGSPESERAYRFAIDDFIAWYCSEPRLAFNKTVVLRYRLQLEARRLSASTINVRLAAVRRLAYEAADSGLLSPELAASIRRVKGPKKLGVRLGNWLTAQQGKMLLSIPGRSSVRDKRDHAMLALLLGCGLRRSEVVHLTIEHLQQRENHWAIIDLVGKGGHVRTVPIPGWVKEAIDIWTMAASIKSGPLFRCVNKTGSIWGQRISEKVVWCMVRKCASKAKIEKLAPHDLRRTCARLCHEAGGELEQIQFLLGHESVQTTERYLGCKQRLREAVNDRIGLEPSPESVVDLTSHSTSPGGPFVTRKPKEDPERNSGDSIEPAEPVTINPMCNRYRLKQSKQSLADRFAAFEEIDDHPRYNIAPTQPVLTVRKEQDQKVRRFTTMRWGLIPSWAKDASIGNRTLNARSETVTTTPAFRESIRTKRCLIPADGFYEWRRMGSVKQPYCFEVGEGEVFAFAGLWDQWRSPDGQIVESCTVLTTTPNSLVADIHDRMPVIVAPDKYELWLDPDVNDFEAIRSVLKPYDANLMRRYPVSMRLNNSKNDDAESASAIALDAASQKPLF